MTIAEQSGKFASGSRKSFVWVWTTTGIGPIVLVTQGGRSRSGTRGDFLSYLGDRVTRYSLAHPRVRWSYWAMSLSVLLTEDAREALDLAGDFLSADPVRNNVILTLLNERATTGEPGRYWLVSEDARVAGVVFQSPLDYTATMTAMSSEAVAAVVETICSGGVNLPGITGEAAVAAMFAGQWTEVNRAAAMPVEGQRIYEVRVVERPTTVAGRLRQAEAADRDLVVGWFDAFHIDIGEGHGGGGLDAAAAVVDRRLPRGDFRIWDSDRAVSMAATSTAVAGVVRISAVYTPPELRGSGYATSCVAELSDEVLTGGNRCILYTDLGNPTSNSIYRKIGYRATTEVLRYQFE